MTDNCSYIIHKKKNLTIKNHSSKYLLKLLFNLYTIDDIVILINTSIAGYVKGIIRQQGERYGSKKII